MAKISGTTEEKVFQLKAWMGLNENPDGDTKLKLGEAAVMRNFAVTRDGNLRRRAGLKTAYNTGGVVRGLWAGLIRGKKHILCASNGKLIDIFEQDGEEYITIVSGGINTDNEVFFLPFSNIVYILNGVEYYQYDGLKLSTVDGYRPLVTIAVSPAGGGETLEQVNKLNGKRRLWISPDGKGATFQLPETGLFSIDWVKDLKTGSDLEESEYTYDLTAGTVTFNSAPEQSVNSYEIAWTMATNYRSDVSSMHYGELYSGTQDTRVFLYGNGTNKALYSGLDYDGKPRADYFPDMNEVKVGDENTPITGMIRHYSTLVCYKTSSAWSIQYGIITLADGTLTPAFYVTPMNKNVGNVAMGQVRLVLNSPRTLCGNDLFEWRNNASYSSNLSIDERQAKRISDRINATLSSFNFEKCYCYDDNDRQEYYICYDGKALVHNYAVDAWYVYTNFPATAMCGFKGELIIGTSKGTIERMSYNYLSDNGEAIDAYWESGSMSFGMDYKRKYSAQLWIGIKPESSGEITVTMETDRKSSYPEKVVASNMASFRKANFSRWSFKTNRRPQMVRLKLKAKKFVFYKLIFESKEPDTTATVLAADIRVRFTGYAK